MNTAKFTGQWQSRYTYHEADIGEHVVTFVQQGPSLMVGKGTAENGSQLTLELVLDADNRVLTGTWHEVTSLMGEYKGAIFHGVVQFIVSTDLDSAAGKWVGFNKDRTKINAGEWALTHL